MPHQLPPEGDWRTWVVMGGRGAGKTRAGAEWVRAQVTSGNAADRGLRRRVGLIAETYEQAREVMVFGESGIIAISPEANRPKWIAGRKLLEWANGATAQVFSAQDFEALRGPQFDAVWVDEFAKWRKPAEAWDMIQFCLRLGDAPRACVTTTPRNTTALKELLARASTVKTHAKTSANRANLAADFMAEMEARYAGTRLGRQELSGELLTDVAGAMWTHSALAKVQVRELPKLARIVVAVDPPVTGHKNSDAHDEIAGCLAAPLPIEQVAMCASGHLVKYGRKHTYFGVFHDLSRRDHCAAFGPAGRHISRAYAHGVRLFGRWDASRFA